MINPSIRKEILDNLDGIPFEEQKIVLDFVKSLAVSKKSGIPGQELLIFSGIIGKSEIASMEKAIESGCERIDLNGW